MVEEGTTAPEGAPAGQPRVVKKVVKRTVVRPSAPGATATTRPKVEAPRATAVSRLGKDAPRPARTPGAPKQRLPRATVDVGAKASAARDRARTVGAGGTDLARRGWFRVRDLTEDAFWAVRDWRVPEIAPVPAGVVTGLLAGLFVTAGGGLAQMLFSATRGTSAGGGLWGGLAVLVVVLLAHEGGARLLAAFGGVQTRAVTALSAIVVAVVVMVLFVDAVDGPWAWLILPGLCAAVVPLVQQLLTWSASE